MLLSGSATQSHDGNVSAPAQCLPARPDVLLQASRRIDWRFLLPDPDLGRVAYLGVRDEDHIRSLRLFSESLVCVDSDPHCGQFDAAVVRDPSATMLQQAARVVKTEGILYVEVAGLARLAARRPGLTSRRPRVSELALRHPAGCAAAIRRLGFTDVQLQWHWPDFASCTKIIPLHHSAALRYALGRGGPRYKARLQATLGHALLRTGLLGWTVQYFSVLAQRVDPQRVER